MAELTFNSTYSVEGLWPMGLCFFFLCHCTKAVCYSVIITRKILESKSKTAKQNIESQFFSDRSARYVVSL